MYEVIIIGCGPSGMSAAINLKLAGVDVAIIEKNVPGGQMNMATNIKNYPGYTDISGQNLSLNMFNQVRELEIPYIYGQVVQINDADIKQIVTNKGTYEANYIVIATGRIHQELGLPNEKNYLGNGISYSSTLNIEDYKDKEIMIVGSSNETIDQALILASKAFSVTIINEEKELDIDDDRKNMLEEKTNIHYLGNSKITKLFGEEKLEEIEISNIVYNEKYNKKLDYLYISKEYEPQTSFLKNTDINMIGDYIHVYNNKTNIKNIFAIGDVTKKDVYQISNAIGEGAVVAYDIIKRISTN